MLISELKRILSLNYYRSIILLTQISLRNQYKTSFLGTAWSLIQPAVYIAIMSTVFSIIMRVEMKDFVLYMSSGLLPWNFMVASLTGSCLSIVSKEPILKRNTLSKTMFIISDILVHVYTFLLAILSMEIIVGIFIVRFIHPTIILLPVVIIPLLITVISVGIMLAYLASYIRDIYNLITILFNALFWTLPIAYPVSFIPADKLIYFDMNPFYILIKPIREVIYYGNIPTLKQMLLAGSVSLFAALFSFVIYRKLRRNIIYYL